MNDFRRTVGIVGYGLIGGSLGIALKETTLYKVIAIDKDKETIEYIKKHNLADEVYECSEKVLKECDIIFIALYPSEIVSFVKENIGNFKNNAKLVDLCGIKTYIVEEISKLKNKNFSFIGAHPMAGKEVGGIKNAHKNLYENASFLMTSNDDEIESIAYKVGFSKVIVTTDVYHDKMITYTSQLPHILSVAYVLQENFKKCDGFYAGSFQDFCRVGKINEHLWSELFLYNKDILTSQIDEYIKTLKKMKQELEDQGIKEMLSQSRILKEWQDEKDKC